MSISKINTATTTQSPIINGVSHFATATSSSTSQITVVSVSGKGGYLTGLTSNSGYAGGDRVTIVIDGTTICSSQAFSTQANTTTAIPVFLRFNSSLTVSIASVSSSYASNLTVFYMTDN